MKFKKLNPGDERRQVVTRLTTAELKRIYNALLIDYKSEDDDDPDLADLIRKIDTAIID
jgi:hypothetical protein